MIQTPKAACPAQCGVPPWKICGAGQQAGRLFHRGLVCALLVLALVFAPPWIAPCRGVETHDDALLSLYLYNFLLFVDWPAEAFTAAGTITIGVLGDTDAVPRFHRLDGKRIRGKKLVVHNVSRVKDIQRHWHVLFIRLSNPSNAALAIGMVEESPCLTMSDMEGFTEQGGMVEFVSLPRPENRQEDPGGSSSNRRFRIRLDEVLDAGLRIRSRLLRLSDVVEGRTDGTRSNP